MPITRQVNVRYGSLADIGERIRDVRFTPRSGHVQRRQRCRLSAISGHRSILISNAPFYSPTAFVGESFSITSSRLKLAGFWRIGNSLKLSSHCADDRLRRNQQRTPGPPSTCRRRSTVVAPLERIGAQVEQLRHAQLVNGSRQTSMPVCSLLLEDDLPVADADGDQFAVVAPVEEPLARRLLRPRP